MGALHRRPFTPLILERFNFYERIRSKSAQTAVWQLIRGILVIGIIISVFSVFAQLGGTRRLILGTGALFMFVILFVGSGLCPYGFRADRKKGIGGERVVVVGSENEISALLGDLDPEAISDWEIVERFDLATRTSEELFGILKEESIGRVVFAAKTSEFEKVAVAVEICELQGVEAWIAASFIRTQIARPTFDSVGSKPMLVLRSTPELSWELMAKEIIDRVGAFVIILDLPAVGLRGDRNTHHQSWRAEVFSQMRAGRDGQPFKMWKFRTMVSNAEELLDQMKKEHGNQMDGPSLSLSRSAHFLLRRATSEAEYRRATSASQRADRRHESRRPLPAALYEVEDFGRSR